MMLITSSGNPCFNTAPFLSSGYVILKFLLQSDHHLFKSVAKFFFQYLIGMFLSTMPGTDIIYPCISDLFSDKMYIFI
ncbi:hypothetical protein SAMN05216356_1143 [Oribacterium sp. WCC10]|nr:hypothetical protein SAMN05216356_1143 [Oribacterium sp. WCC10]